MNKIKVAITFLLLSAASSATFAIDTLSSVQLNEITIIAPKEEQADYPSILVPAISRPAHRTEAMVANLSGLSAVASNFYIPDYGSKITSSIYVRGIGSRMNEPSVGLYVDNIPYLDKGAFNFDFYDIEYVIIHKGPQGTLYGRNSIGGLVTVTTLSPFNYQGTRLSASYGRFNDQRYKLSHYRKANDELAFSVAGYYNRDDGYFTNQYNGQKNNSESFGGRAKVEWHITPKWHANLSLVFDKTFQHAYPYARYDMDSGEIGAINYNEEGSYGRKLFTSGLSLQRKGNAVLFTSITGYQYLDDVMKIDQDFTATPVYALSQGQRQYAVTQEFVFRSNDRDANYQWTAGAFGFYKGLNVGAPMIFREGALGTLVENLPPFIINWEAEFPGKFKIPAYGAALYHQSSYKFWDKLTLTGGIRFEYEKTSMDYNTSAEMIVNVTPPTPQPVTIPYPVGDTVRGKLAQSFFNILPKVAVKYDFNDEHNVYVSVSRGYKTGGFNFQMFSDVLQQNMMNQMPHVPHDETPVDLDEKLSYKPEYTINYEIGTHSKIRWNEVELYLDLAAFYIDYTDQQIVTFSSTNVGNRKMENAGRSESVGFEANLNADITNDFSIDLTYGYTKATFKEYNTGEHDYSGNYIPLVPRNTLSVSAAYVWNTNLALLDNVIFRAEYNALGKLYFTEENNISQNFYGLLNGTVSFVKDEFELSFWIKNALDKKYKTFYFTSLNNSFVQQGRPMQIGVSLSAAF